MITRFLWQGMDRNLRLFVLLVLAIGIVLPLLNQLMPPTSAFYVPAWVLQLIGKYLCFASLALAVDLVWGYLRHPHARPRRLLRAGRLLHGHVPDAPDRHARRLRQSDPARLHGVPELPGAALVLARLPPFLVRRPMIVIVPSVLALALGWFAFRSRVTGVYLSIITQAMTFALLLAFFRNDMGLGGNNGMTDFKDILGFSVQADATRAVLCFCLGAGARDLPGDLRRRRRLALRQGADRRARRRKPHALPRLPRRGLQALRLRAVGRHGGHRGRALRAAGRHHQSQRILARQLDRGGAVGRRRRPRHADRAGDRRLHRQLRQDLPDRRAARGLAVRAGRAVHRRHAVPAQGRRRPVGADTRTAPRRKARAT